MLFPCFTTNNDETLSPLREAMEMNRSVTELKLDGFSSKETVDPNTDPHLFLIQYYLYRNRCGLHHLRTDEKHKVLPLAFARVLTVPDDEEHSVGLPHRQQVVFDFIRTVPNLFMHH